MSMPRSDSVAHWAAAGTADASGGGCRGTLSALAGASSSEHRDDTGCDDLSAHVRPPQRPTPQPTGRFPKDTTDVVDTGLALLHLLLHDVQHGHPEPQDRQLRPAGQPGRRSLPRRQHLRARGPRSPRRAATVVRLRRAASAGAAGRTSCPGSPARGRLQRRRRRGGLRRHARLVRQTRARRRSRA